MTTRSDKTPEILEAIGTLRQSLDALNARVEAQNLVVQSVADAQNAMAEGFSDLNSRVDGLTSRVDGLTSKVDGLTDDIAEVKGEHARSAMLRSAPLIADALDCQLIAEVPRGILLGFAKIVESNGEPRNRVQSFKNADMILHVLNADNQPGYVAVEASFTVDDRDVTRAARNADYLQRFTGLPSYPVVAGVAVLQDAQDRIDQEEAHLYRIHPRELQPD